MRNLDLILVTYIERLPKSWHPALRFAGLMGQPPVAFLIALLATLTALATRTPNLAMAFGIGVCAIAVIGATSLVTRPTNKRLDPGHLRVNTPRSANTALHGDIYQRPAQAGHGPKPQSAKRVTVRPPRPRRLSPHAASSLIIYGLIAYLAGQIMPIPWQISLWFLCLIFIVLIGASRVWYCAQLPAEILTSWALGLIVLIGIVVSTQI